MRKFYRIAVLIVFFLFLTTYSPKNLNDELSQKSSFFKIQNIEVKNNKTIKKKEIITRLNHIYQKNIFFISKSEILEPIESIDFLDKITVKKKYPNTIIINIYETKPVAILFQNKKKYFLDNLSKLIVFDETKFSEIYPTVLGEGAENTFVQFFNELKNNDFAIDRIKNYYYFKINRWDLELANGQIIKFPPNITSQIIKQSSELLNHSDFKNYGVIDLRIHGKIVVE